MLRKVSVKKSLTPKQRFELLFREPTPEEKEIIEMTKSRMQKTQISVWCQPVKNKKKYIYKMKPIFAIKENLGNGYYIMYYKYSGHALFYKDNALVGIINSEMNLNPKDFEHNSWLSVVTSSTTSFLFHSLNFKSYYEAIKTDLIKERKIKGETRQRFTIIYKE